jgi:hypothetical protein
MEWISSLLKLVSMLGYGYWICEFVFVPPSCFDTGIITHSRLTLHLNGLRNLYPQTV